MLRNLKVFLLPKKKSTKTEVRQSRNQIKSKQKLAERGFDPRTSGLWAQHASTAPLCFWQIGVFETQDFTAFYEYTFTFESRRLLRDQKT